MGELRSTVRSIIYRWLNQELTDQVLKQEIQKTVNKFGDIPFVFQDIGLVVMSMKDGIGVERYERIFQLLDEVEPRIKKDLENWKKGMAK